MDAVTPGVAMAWCGILELSNGYRWRITISMLSIGKLQFLGACTHMLHAVGSLLRGGCDVFILVIMGSKRHVASSTPLKMRAGA